MPAKIRIKAKGRQNDRHEVQDYSGLDGVSVRTTSHGIHYRAKQLLEDASKGEKTKWLIRDPQRAGPAHQHFSVRAG